MAWQGEERRSGKERRLVERRRTSPYKVRSLIVIDGLTWIEQREDARRFSIRRREDRERIAKRFLLISRQD
jgi:hypothetical protein